MIDSSQIALEIIEHLYTHGASHLGEIPSVVPQRDLHLAVHDHPQVFNTNGGLLSLAYKDLAYLGRVVRIEKMLEVRYACRKSNKPHFDMYEVSDMTALPPSEAREVMVNNPDMFQFLGYPPDRFDSVDWQLNLAFACKDLSTKSTEATS